MSDWFEVDLRVRYAETDQMGVVYYANHLVWFEMARTELFRSMGIEYSRLETEREIFLPVAEAYCRYRFPLRYDDEVAVRVKIKEIGTIRLSFEYEILKNGKAAATGYTNHAFVDRSGRPVPVPVDIREAMDRLRR